MDKNKTGKFPHIKKLLIKGGKIVSSNGGIIENSDLLLSNKKILAISSHNKKFLDFTPDEVIDAKNKIVCPGFIDCSVRIRKSGFEFRSTLESEIDASVAGGVTNIICPPDTHPTIDEPGLAKMLIQKAHNYQKSHVYPLGALTKGLKGKIISEMAELSKAGCVGFTQSNKPIKDTLVLLKALQYASSFNLSVWLNPVDPWLGNNGVAHSGSVSTRLGLSGIPSQSESISILTILELVRLLDVKVHFCRVSSFRGVELIREAKREGLNVTADVSIHHLHLTHIDIESFNTNIKTFPPFRTERDKKALSEGLIDGTIDFICSDHISVEEEDKNLPFSQAEAGLMGVELLLPLTLKWARDNNINLQKALSFITTQPSKVLGLKQPGLKIGEVADICIFDEYESWCVDSKTLSTQTRNSPFYGYEVQGRVYATIIDGVCFYNKKI
ncbi:MAG: dihydroorotase [Betaproteobacteria bacterium TMED156]|nr:MAG: dihydroorotase [Betaproteobacteria bacterium TMED156]